MDAEGKIDNVSDTALWVAVYRARETERPDALFKDPLAAVLAGERGRRIAAEMSGAKLMGWVMAIRTLAIDGLVLHALELGADTVLNLGAGLDTRPYRMTALPSGLRWVEVDFPHMIELKNQKLAAEKPLCRLERIPLDLADRARRREMLARVASESKGGIVVITEGVIPYLEAQAVRELAEDLFAQKGIRLWIQDYISGGYVRRGWSRRMRSAPLRFQVKDWFAFFAPLGWRPRRKISTISESERVGRRPPFDFPSSLFWILRFVFATPARRRRMREMFGYVLLERGESG